MIHIKKIVFLGIVLIAGCRTSIETAATRINSVENQREKILKVLENKIDKKTIHSEYRDTSIKNRHSESTKMPRKTNQMYAVIAKNGLIVREQPSSAGERLGKVPFAQYVLELKKTDKKLTLTDGDEMITGHWINGKLW